MPSNEDKALPATQISFQFAEHVTVSGMDQLDHYIMLPQQEQVSRLRNGEPVPLQSDSPGICQVDPGATGKGKNVISAGFGPCQAVIARMNDGNFAVYHAYSAFSRGKHFSGLIDLLKEEKEKNHIAEIWLIEKDNKKHREKAPILAVELSAHFELPVNRLLVKDYTAVYCDAASNTVTLCPSPEGEKYIKEGEFNVELQKLTPIALKAQNQSSEKTEGLVIPIAQSIQQLEVKNAYDLNFLSLSSQVEKMYTLGMAGKSVHPEEARSAVSKDQDVPPADNKPQSKIDLSQADPTKPRLLLAVLSQKLQQIPGEEAQQALKKLTEAYAAREQAKIGLREKSWVIGKALAKSPEQAEFSSAVDKAKIIIGRHVLNDLSQSNAPLMPARNVSPMIAFDHQSNAVTIKNKLGR